MTAISNIQKSSKYLLTTTFPVNGCNRDINFGEWRALDLSKNPYNLQFIEIFTEGDRAKGFEDKGLGLVKMVI
jgi:hypothetical protein